MVCKTKKALQCLQTLQRVGSGDETKVQTVIAIGILIFELLSKFILVQRS